MSFLSPIVDAAYGYPSVGFGWQSFGSSYPVTPFFSSPYSDPYFSYASPIGGRYFYGSLFGPTFGGVSFSPYFDSYHADLFDAGARLLSWGNIIEADPFYRARYPWFYEPYIPFIPFWPIPAPVNYNPAPAAPAQAQASQAAQPSGAGQANQGNEGVRQWEEQNRELKERNEQLAKQNEEIAKQNEQIIQFMNRNAGGHGGRTTKAADNQTDGKPGTRTIPGVGR